MAKLTETEQWELGGEIMDRGPEHPAVKAVTESLDSVLEKLEEVRRFSANLKKVGVGRTEDATLIVARLVPALREHSKIAERVANQLAERLG